MIFNIFKIFKSTNNLKFKINYRKMSQNCYYDPCSFSNPANYLITHASFDWNVDFYSKIIKGICDLTFNKNSTESADSSIVSLFFKIQYSLLQININHFLLRF
jgi:hypothetical protein